MTLSEIILQHKEVQESEGWKTAIRNHPSDILFLGANEELRFAPLRYFEVTDEVKRCLRAAGYQYYCSKQDLHACRAIFKDHFESFYKKCNGRNVEARRTYIEGKEDKNGNLKYASYWARPTDIDPFVAQPSHNSVQRAFDQYDPDNLPDSFGPAKSWFVTDPKTSTDFPVKIVWGLATGGYSNDGNSIQFKKRLERAGFECANLSDVSLTAPTLARIFEGADKQLSYNSKERSQVARKNCIDHYRQNIMNGRLACLVCDLDFSERYGELGEGFIHVHHLNPLSETDGIRETIPQNDLVPVCPNCHAMIHRDGKTRTIHELRQIIKSA